MQLHQLRYLVALAEEQSFTRAAARVNVAQPALSRQLRKLEDELAVPLVDRTSRRVKMTAQGLALVERARRILAEVDEARAEVRGATRLLSGRIAIGLTPTPGPIDVARVLGGFHAKYPEVELALREELSVSLADRLRADDLDVAFVSGIGRAARRQLTLHPLAREPLVAILPPGHRHAAQARLQVRELHDEWLIAFPPSATIRATIDAAAARAGFRPRIAFETYDLHRARALVAHGLGIAILPRSDALVPGHDIAIVPLGGRDAKHEVSLAWRSARRLAPAAKAVIEHVTEGIR
jgi:DNA-binding transcriptional LysR family regulator